MARRQASRRRVRHVTRSVLIVGLGGLGCPAADLLARAGVERLGLVDFDHVEPSNLDRQTLYTPADVDRPKVEAAAERLRAVAPGVRLESHPRPFEAGMVEGYDVVLDGTDDPGGRALIHQACLDAGVPLVWGAVSREEGQTTVVVPGEGPCLRCLWPTPGDAPACDDRTPGPATATIGALQASAALRLVAGRPVPTGELTLYDGATARFRTIRFDRRSDCPGCGHL